MKRKKAVMPSPASVEHSVSKTPVMKHPAMDVVWVCLFSGLLFVSMTIQTGQMSMCLAVLALALSVGRTPLRNLRQRFCVPVIGLVAYAVMNGAAAIYSPFDSYALAEFYKFVAVFAIAVILLTRFERRHVPGLLWGMASIGGIIGIVSIDGACEGKIYALYNAMVESLGYSLGGEVQEAGLSRIVGIYNDANVTACLFGMAAMISLYLLAKENMKIKRLCASLLCGINAVAFFLSLSRGAIVFFALSLVIWLAAANKGERIRLFFLFMASMVATLCCAALISLYADHTGTVTCLLTLLCGVMIFALDYFLVRRLAAVAEQHPRAVLGTVSIAVLVCLGYVIAAVTLTGPMRFQGQTRLIRELSPEPGTYTVFTEGEGLERAGAFVVEERITGEWIFLASGSGAENLTFTVPENMAGHLLVGIEGRKGVILERLALSDGKELPLRHYLIPEAVEDRIFNSTTKNLEQRIQFCKDAWTLFLQSPLTGHGLGSTEGLYRSVQPFSYESKYVHNHILQVMSDMGLLGLAGFAALLLGSGWLLITAVRKEKDGLSAMLLAVWVLLNGHSLMEINFSVRGFACFAFATLLLPVLLYAKPLLREDSNSGRKVVNIAGVALLMVCCLYQIVFGGLLLSHRSVEKEQETFQPTSQVAYMKKLQDYIRRDVFVREQHKLDFVAYTQIWGLNHYRSQAEEYVADLRASGTYFACSGLAKYYYLPLGQWEELFAASREGIAQTASSPDGWNLQVEFYRTTVLPAMGEENIGAFLEGVTALADWLEEFNTGRIEPIALTEANQKFLTGAKSAGGIPSDAAWLVLTALAAQQE